MKLISNIKKLMISLEGEFVERIVYMLEELDIGDQSDYEFDFCSSLFMEFRGGKIVELRSIDVDSNYSLYARNLSSEDFALIMNGFSKNCESSIRERFFNGEKLQEVKIVESEGYIEEVRVGLENHFIDIKSGYVYDEEDGSEIVTPDEMLLLYITRKGRHLI
ncbi:hypothetical protein [Hahella ganghwensis]|uniref:hypothetical protein n=1 Tax=Hahella ganghwensis TaxID=286420 RepID=UPI00035D6331|nr:hypothetical protein [Hahella ganghwensis]